MSKQISRTVKIIQKMQSGGKFTTNEILEFLSHDDIEVNLRTIQRDLKTLEDLNVIENENPNSNELIWKIIKENIVTKKSRKLKSSELISFYILKSQLKSFKSTIIEDEIEVLTRIIEEIAPDDVFKNIYWDQSLGAFDYKQYDAIVRRCITYISTEKWVDLQYDTGGNGKIKNIVAFPCSLFNYNGNLYLAIYEFKHKSYIALAIQNIESMIEKEDFYTKKPVFDYHEFAKSRFAVYNGEIHNVKLKISSDVAKYFVNRTWHITQVLRKQTDGSYLLTMDVPIGEDLVAWIMSWSPSIEVLAPQKLIDKLKDKISKSLILYI
jgi:predicted DNA-binding transcriptional regulator YafY